MTTWSERVASDESERFERYAAEIRAMQKRNNTERNGPRSRALHVKAHVGAVAKLVVPANVDEKFRAGIFRAPHEWPAYVRFSSGSSRKQHDKAPDTRGVAVKLVGVPGTKIISALADKVTQDFLFIPTPSIPFRDPDEFVAFIRAASQSKSPLQLVAKLFGAFGLSRGLQVLKRLSKEPKVTSMITHRFFTSVPVRIGDVACKLALFPIQGAARSAPPASASGSASASGDERNKLREDLVHTLAHGGIEYSVRAQAFVDETTTPIEDASVTWPESVSPYVEIARLVFPQQDVTTARGKEIEELIEHFSFDPWHAIEEHRPLGAIMRARAVAYRETSIERAATDEPAHVLKST